MKSLLVALMALGLLALASCGGGSAAPNPTPQDTTPPEIQINGVSDGQMLGLEVGGDNIVIIRGIAADPAGVTNSSMRINDTLIAATNESEVSFKWNVKNYDDGSYEIEVRAADAYGNISSASLTVVVDNVPALIDPGIFPVFPVDPGYIIVELIPGL